MQKTWVFLELVLSLVLFMLAAPQCSQGKVQRGMEANQEPGDYSRSLIVDGRERSYIVHTPSAYRGQNPLPLVIDLHGGGGNASNAMRVTGMSNKADTEGFIVAFPNGTGRLKNRLLTWNAGGVGYASDHNVDDVAFIRTLIEHLQKEFNIDARRIYVTGISNGARMAYRLGCELSDKIAAIAPVAGSLDIKNCQPVQPLSVIAFHGTADAYFPYEGGVPTKGGRPNERVTIPVSSVIAFWVKHNHCSTSPQKQERGNIIQETYTGCRDGTAVVLYTIKGGGHAWPGGKKGSPRGDEPTQEISATDLMWDFFVRHPKR